MTICRINVQTRADTPFFFFARWKALSFRSTFWNPHSHDRCFCCHFASWHTSGFSSPFHNPHCRQVQPRAASHDRSHETWRRAFWGQSAARHRLAFRHFWREPLARQQLVPISDIRMMLRSMQTLVLLDAGDSQLKTWHMTNSLYRPLRLGRQAARHKKQG